MFKLGSAPSPQASINELADFFEIEAWTNGSTSLRDIQSSTAKLDDALNNSGCEDDDTATSDRLDDIAAEIDRRSSACGPGRYPFKFNATGSVLHHVAPADEQCGHVYRYLLLATRLNMSNDRKHDGIDGALLFEELAAEVIRNYFGGRAETHVFGTSTSGQFGKKVTRVCGLLGEGGGFFHMSKSKLTANDGKLDTVTWVPFSDQRAGKLVVFNQCKTGTSWRDTVSQLWPKSFIKKWMQEPIAVDPVRAFTVAECVTDRWFDTVADAGIVFDRCRVVDFCETLETSLVTRIKKWSDAASAANGVLQGA